MLLVSELAGYVGYPGTDVDDDTALVDEVEDKVLTS